MDSDCGHFHHATKGIRIFANESREVGSEGVGWVGLEPTTNALKGRCSTIELPTRLASLSFYAVSRASARNRRDSLRRPWAIPGWRASVIPVRRAPRQSGGWIGDRDRLQGPCKFVGRTGRGDSRAENREATTEEHEAIILKRTIKPKLSMTYDRTASRAIHPLRASRKSLAASPTS